MNKDPLDIAQSTDSSIPQNSSIKVRKPFWLFLYPLAFILSLDHIFGIFTLFGVFPRSTDSYYHLHRIMLTIENYPHVPDYDSYLNFPDGALTFWPYGFDIIYATFAKLLTGGHPDQWWTMALCSLLTPLIWSFVPCFIYLMGTTLGSSRIGLWAAILIAIYNIDYHSVGYIDHHIFETFWLSVYLLVYLRAITYQDWWRARYCALLSGMAITAGLLCTTVLPLLIPVHAALVLSQLIREWSNKQERQRILSLNLYLWTALVITLTPFVATHIAEPTAINPALSVSWLVALLVGLLIAAITFKDSYKVNNDCETSLKKHSWSVLTTLLVLATFLTIPNLKLVEITKFIVYGIEHIYKADPWLASIQESQSPFLFNQDLVLSIYSGFIFLWPLILVWALFTGWRRSTARWTVAVLALLATVPACLQMKFVMFLITPYTIVLGLFIYEIFTWLKLPLPLGEPSPTIKLRIGQLIAISLLILLLSPLLATFTLRYNIVDSDGRFLNLYPTFKWLKEHSPTTSRLGKDLSDYSVVAHWGSGHWLVFFSQRPVVASPLGHNTTLRAAIRQGSAMLMKSPQEALPLMEYHKVRYIIIAPQPTTKILQLAHWKEDTAQVEPYNETTAIDNSLFSYLTNDGLPDRNPLLHYFRLVHESPSGINFPGSDRPYAMLFERVKGAEITGQAKPNSTVRISLQVNTLRGRKFFYYEKVQSDANGNFNLRVPYAVGVQRYSEVYIKTPYIIQNEDQTIKLNVTESDVLTGKKLVVEFPSSTEKLSLNSKKP